MDNIISEQRTQNPPAALVTARIDLSIINPATPLPGKAGLHTTFLPLCRPDDIIADPAKLRIGDAEISPRSPRL